MEWALLPLKRYATFSGRSRRKEYWLFFLFIVIVSTVLSMIDSLLGFGGARAINGVAVGARGGPLSSIFSLAIFIPALAVGVRRLHDIDRSGWWLLAPVIMYVPLIALVISAVVNHEPNFVALAIVGLLIFALSILLLVFFCLPGTPGPNRFGDDPLGQSPEALGEVFR